MMALVTILICALASSVSCDRVVVRAPNCQSSAMAAQVALAQTHLLDNQHRVQAITCTAQD
jgi:hypothetical protein